MSGDTLFDAIPPEVSSLLVDFSDSIEEVNKLILAYKEALTANNNNCELSGMQRVQTELSLAYATNALFYAYLRCRGVDTTNHPIVVEMQRVTNCLKRCQNLCKKASESRTPQLDKDASARFIKRALWQNAQTQNKRRKKETNN